jgi:hypothetical protein
MRSEKLNPGYHIFTVISSETFGMEKCAAELQRKINEAEKDFDMTFVSNASFKDDPAGRNVYFGSQTVVLTRKKK